LNWRIVFLPGLVAGILSSCSVTRRLPPDQYLLSGNRVEIAAPADLPRAERIDRSELSEYIRQRPNKRIFGLPVYLWIYNLSAPDKQNWTKRIGEAPVIYDPLQARQSVSSISNYLWARGFVNNSVDWRADTTGRKVRVRYDAVLREPYRLGNVTWEFQDAFLEPIVRQDSARTLLRPGEVFNADAISAERVRVADNLKNQGYYNFSFNNITPVADSVSHPGTIDLRMVVRQRRAGTDATGEPVFENNTVYRIRNIYVESDYDPDLAFRDPDYAGRLDTLEERGIHFLYRGGQNIRPDVLIQAINIYPNDVYSKGNVERAYDNLTRLNYFRNVNILYTEVIDSSANLISFVGDDGASENLTREMFLDYRIQCTAGEKMGVTANLEGMGTSNYYGILTTVGYQNRNVFRGVEMLDFSVTAGYEFMRNKGQKNSLELGGSVGMTFPRFVAPVRIDRYYRMNQVKTRIELSANSQDRPFYNRFLTSGSFGYSWSNNRYGSFTLRPIDITVVKMNRLDEGFFRLINNEYLRRSYTSQLIAGISGSYVYNTRLKGDARRSRNTFRLRLNAETNGNLLGLAAPLIGSKKEGQDDYTLFGIQYAQYVRSDLDLSYYMPTGAKTGVATRFFIGGALPYGNSTEIPFERLFYAGGPNSMRGWQARTLGPGNTPFDADTLRYPIQQGNFRLEANLEYRFPVYRVLQGAVFVDVGNVWRVGDRSEGVPAESRFRFDRFYKQLGVDSGLGARFDFNFFLLRVDWGLQLHNPNRAPGDRWIRRLTLRQSAFSFNVGFPF
jgi:outer membrane protein assembly factor BamA